MNRLFSTFLAASLVSASSVACSSSASSDAPSDVAATTSDAFTSFPSCGAFELRRCYPGEGPRGRTVCGCEAVVGSPNLPAPAEGCGPALAQPPGLAACSRGGLTAQWHLESTNAWVCPVGTRVPAGFGSASRRNTQSGCVGDAEDGYFFVTQNVQAIVHCPSNHACNPNPNGCGGPCGLTECLSDADGCD